MHDLAPCHNSKSTRILLDRNGIPVLEWPGNSPGNESHRKCLEYNEKIGNQMPCKIEEMWKRVCEARYSVALNVLKELDNSMPRRIADLIENKWRCNRILTL